MGAPDTLTKQFFSNKRNFADLFNIGLFHERMLIPENLEQVNPNVVSGLFQGSGNRVYETLERTLDDARLAHIMMHDGLATYLILGAEYEDLIHPALPVRHLLDIAMVYARQIQEISSRNRETARIAREAKKNSAEASDSEPKIVFQDSGQFLSGLTPDDRLNPVIIAALYAGNKPWYGPRTLSEMLSTTDPRILRYTCEYRVNLIIPEDIPDRNEYHGSDFWQLMRILAAGHQGKEDLYDLFKTPDFAFLPDDTVRLVNTLLKTNIPTNPNKGGQVDMCRAMLEINAEISDYKNQIYGYESRISGYESQIAQQNNQIAEQEREIARLKAMVQQFGIS